MSTAEDLLHEHRQLWSVITNHPFVVTAGEGTLPAATFARWLVEDHVYVVEFRRFLATLAAAAPDEEARELLLGAQLPLQAELDLFRAEAASRGLDLDVEPAPTTLGYASWLHAAALDGFAVGCTVLYAAEKAYYDAWAAVRERAEGASPYWSFIDNWSAPAFGAWVEEVAGVLDRVSPYGPTPAQRRAFGRCARFELRFWDAVHAGEGWDVG